MNNRQGIRLWAYATISLVIGFVFVQNGSRPGWFLIALGITYLGTSTKIGRTWSDSHPGLARWGLVGISAVLIVLFVVVTTAQLLS